MVTGLRAAANGMALLVVAASAVAQTTRRIQAPDIRPTNDPKVRVDTLWRTGDKDERRETTFALVSDTQFDSTGHLIILDTRECAIRVLTVGGAYVRSFGAPGTGPGEFKLPTALSVAPDGTILVYDSGLGVISEFRKDYSYIRSIRPSVMIGNVSSILATRDRLFIAGVGTDSKVRGRTIHAFTRDGDLLQSFGDPTPGPTPDVSRMLGAGKISRARDGGIWQAQPAPYLIRKFSPQGSLLVEIERANNFLPRADSAFHIRLEGKTMITTNRPHAASIRVRELRDGSLIHQTRLADGRSITDFYNQQYVLIRSAYDIPGMSAQIGPDRFASLISGTSDTPAIAGLRITLAK